MPARWPACIGCGGGVGRVPNAAASAAVARLVCGPRGDGTAVVGGRCGARSEGAGSGRFTGRRRTAPQRPAREGLMGAPLGWEPKSAKGAPRPAPALCGYPRPAPPLLLPQASDGRDGSAVRARRARRRRRRFAAALAASRGAPGRLRMGVSVRRPGRARRWRARGGVWRVWAAVWRRVRCAVRRLWRSGQARPQRSEDGPSRWVRLSACRLSPLRAGRDCCQKGTVAARSRKK